MRKRITYTKVGDDYSTKDPTKILAQKSAKKTAANLEMNGFFEVQQSRGESAYVWEQGSIMMASVIEGLGTKNLIADGMRKITGKTYYDSIAHDTVATIVNDLISVGATPLVLHAYWAVENNTWLSDMKRMEDLISGWKKASDIAGCSWGGGETPTLQGVMKKDAVELGGSAVGIIKNKKFLVTDTKLKAGDAILFLKSNGINANGASLVRAVAKNLPKGYATLLPNGKMFGEEALSKSNIYARLILALQKANIDIHYISNITGHGLRKIMRARPEFTYVIQNIVNPPNLFTFIQEHANLSDYEIYATLNMGMDYAIFIPEKHLPLALSIIKLCGFSAIHAGHIENGKKRVIIEPKNLIFEANTLGVRQ